MDCLRRLLVDFDFRSKFLKDFNMLRPKSTVCSLQTHACAESLALADIIGWDVGNWSKCLSHWQPWLGSVRNENSKIVVLGERNGGISLWPARVFKNTLEGTDTLQLTPGKVPYAEDRIHHFVSSVLDNKKPLVAMEESLKVQHVLDAIYASASAGKEVKLA